MRRLSVIVGALSVLLTSGAKAANHTIDTVFLNNMVNEIKQAAKLPSGTAIAVIKNDEVIYEGYFGYRDIAGKSEVNKDSIFYIASVTKPLTALNFLLDKQHNPALESLTMGDMFPDFALASRQQVSVHELLTHTASINNMPLVMATAYSGVHSAESLQQIVSRLSTASSEETGTFKYTNVGYNIYSIYSDRHFDLTWQQKLAKQVFEPAGMTSTTAIRSLISDQTRIAKPYSLPEESNREALYLEKVDATLHAAGGVYTTAADMSTFLLAQLNNGIVNGTRAYPAEVINDSHKQQVTADTSYGDFARTGYAWGWYLGDYKGEKMLHHFGGFAGAHSHLSFMPEQKIGVVVLNNEDFLSAKLTGLIADYVYGTLLNEPNIKASVLTKTDALKNKLSGLEKMIAREKDKIAAREWLLSLPEERYVGNYVHPLLGTIKVRMNEENRFHVSWGVMHSESTSMGETDTIRVELDPTTGTAITFSVGDNVESLSYAGIEFKKV